VQAVQITTTIFQFVRGAWHHRAYSTPRSPANQCRLQVLCPDKENLYESNIFINEFYYSEVIVSANACVALWPIAESGYSRLSFHRARLPGSTFVSLTHSRLTERGSRRPGARPLSWIRLWERQFCRCIATGLGVPLAATIAPSKSCDRGLVESLRRCYICCRPARTWGRRKPRPVVSFTARMKGPQ
jgi:hypothetical protein